MARLGGGPLSSRPWGRPRRLGVRNGLQRQRAVAVDEVPRIIVDFVRDSLPTRGRAGAVGRSPGSTRVAKSSCDRWYGKIAPTAGIHASRATRSALWT